MLVLVFAQRNQTKLVLIDTYSTANFYYALLVGMLCRFLKLKYIPILHGGNLEKRLKNNPKLSKLLFARAYRLVSPSSFLVAVFQQYGYNPVRIPNAIDIRQYTFLQRRQLKPKLLWVRAFAEIYNPTLAVSVLAELHERGFSEATLCMVGPEKDDASFVNTKELAERLAMPVTFTGTLKKEDWISLSKEYDVFLNTTNFDNMPVSVIEAMALGLPVVSTNVGGLPHLLSHAEDALLSAPNDLGGITQHIITLMENPDMVERFTKKARAKAETFDWENVRLQWKELIDQC